MRHLGGAVTAEGQERTGNEQRLEQYRVVLRMAATGIGMAKLLLCRDGSERASVCSVGVSGFGRHAIGSSDVLPAEGALGLRQHAIGSSSVLPGEGGRGFGQCTSWCSKLVETLGLVCVLP